MFWWLVVTSVVAVYSLEFNTNLPFPSICSMYYTIDSCPPDEFFSALTSVCGPPEKVACNTSKAKDLGAPTAAQQLMSFPHPNSCEKYYRLASCREGFNFNPFSYECDYPASKGCPPGCPNLLPAPGFIVRPASCLTSYSNYGDSCTVTCQKPYQHTGAHILTCTKDGWNSTQGLHQLPKCTTPLNLIHAVLETLTEELQGIDSSILFVVDDSGSVTARNFEKQKNFARAVASRFPLSQNRSAGVIFFSDKSRVAVSLKTSNTCSFIKQVNEARHQGGGTDIRLALNQANEVLRNSDHAKKFILLLTDGQSDDATDAANALKEKGVIIMAFGVTGYDEDQLKSIASVGKSGQKLFYGVEDGTAFSVIADYLETTYSEQFEKNCP